MANIAPKADALDFARRLREAMEDCGLNTGRGAGPVLGRRYGVSTVNANAWLKGEHRPDTDRARRMAEDLDVRFEWLYFGTGAKRSRDVMGEEVEQYQIDQSALSHRDRAIVEAYHRTDLETRAVIDRLLELRTPGNGP